MRPSDPLRLFIVEPRGRGGMIHFAYQLAAALAGQGLDVTLVTARDYELADLPHPFAVERRMDLWRLFEEPGPAPTNPLSRLSNRGRRFARRGLRALQLIREWLRLIRYLMAQRPDIVQFGSVEFAFEGLFLAWLRGCGLTLAQICHEFEAREQGAWGRVVSRFNTAIYRNLSVIFLLGESNRGRFLAQYPVPPERTVAIPHGNESLFLQQPGDAKIDLAARYGIAPGEKIVLFFGNLTPSKGLPDLLRAFALLEPSLNARLLIAGYPTKYINPDTLTALAAELGIAERMILDPRYIPIEEVPALMDLAAVVAYPYRSATQSGSLQVAYACGRPVVATRVGGLPEVVEDGVTGCLVEPGDPAGLAEALRTVLEDPDLAERMGRAARHLSETRFSWDAIAAQMAAVYRRIR